MTRSQNMLLRWRASIMPSRPEALFFFGNRGKTSVPGYPGRCRYLEAAARGGGVEGIVNVSSADRAEEFGALIWQPSRAASHLPGGDSLQRWTASSSRTTRDDGRPGK
jgi:hypothetical protein